MNIQKRNEYEEKMNLNGIDTLSGYVPRKVSDTDMKKRTSAVRQMSSFSPKMAQSSVERFAKKIKNKENLIV